MRTRPLIGLALGLLAPAAPTRAAEAQVRPFVVAGTGGSMPQREFGSYAGTGFIGTAGLGATVGSSGLFLLALGSMSRNTHGYLDLEDEDFGYSLVSAAGMNLGWGRPVGGLHAYGFAGGGIHHHRYNAPEGSNDTARRDAFLNLALGLTRPEGIVRPWLQLGGVRGLGHPGDVTSYLALTAGLRVGGR